MRKLLFSCVVVLVACGKGGGDGKSSSGGGDDKVGASCNQPSVHGCRQYSATNVELAGSDSLTKLCTVVDKSAVFAMTPCPTAGSIGSCATPEGTDFYYQGYPGGDAAALAKECADGHPPGKFTPGK